MDKQRSKITRRLRLLGAVVCVLGMAAGALIVLRPQTEQHARDNAEADIISAIDRGEVTVEVDAGALEVSGETNDEDAFLTEFWAISREDTEALTQRVNEAPAKAQLELYGVLRISKIDLTLPVLDGTDKVSIRYGAGHFKSSAAPGQPGTCILLGHRMYTYGKHFNRLDELAEGDEVMIQGLDGADYTYTVSSVSIVKPKEVMTELYKYVVGSNLALVTCHPVRVASHRLIVWCRLEEKG